MKRFAFLLTFMLAVSASLFALEGDGGDPAVPADSQRIQSLPFAPPVGQAPNNRPNDLRLADSARSSLAADSLAYRPRLSSDELHWHSFLTNVPGDWLNVWGMSTSSSGLSTLGMTTGATLGMVTVDRQVWHSTRNFYLRSPRNARIANMFVSWGDGRSHLLLAAGFAGFGAVTGDSRALRAASEITESFLACGAMIQVLKHVSGRESPTAATTRTGRWSLFPNQAAYARDVTRYYAFPSGHLATSMSTLTVILENYPETKPWLRPIGYAVLGCIGAGLCSTGMHWWSDFPLGLYLGYHFGYAAAHPSGDDGQPEKTLAASRLRITPLLSYRGEGLAFSYQL